jgi:flagellar biogenesis protein FliO
MVQAKARDNDRRVFRCGRARRALVAAFVAAAICAGRAAADDAIGTIPAPTPTPIASPDGADSMDASGGHAIAAPSASFAGDAVRTVVALGAVLALALVARQVARRLMDPLAARRPSGVVQILARFPVAKGQTILLLSVGTRILCVHQSAGRMETLSEFTDPTEIAALRSRVEAGSADRARFERELTQSLEREPDGERSAKQARASAPIVTETVDLTRRRSSAMRLVGVRA